MAEDQMQGGDDLYSDNMGDAAPKPEDQKPDQEEDTRGDDQEAILPRTILAGKEFNVGDELVLEVTAIRDGEISVKYSHPKDEDSAQPGEEEGDGDKAEIPAAAKPSLYD
jgi:hypothetical protein